MNKNRETKLTNFYYLTLDKFLLCDTSCLSESERTFDIKVFDLASNEKLLSKLQLYYMVGNFGVTYTYESRGKWFCGYLSSFIYKDEGRHDKLLTNPTIRLLITDDKLLTEVKTILNK